MRIKTSFTVIHLAVAGMIAAGSGMALAQSVGNGLGISGAAPIGGVTVGGFRSSAAVGNPTSASSLAVEGFFNNAAGVGTGTDGSGAKASGGDSRGFANGALSIGAVYSEIETDDGVTHTRATIPLAYSIQPDIDPNHKLNLRLPITFSKNDRDKGMHVGLGVDYRYPVTDQWSLTPALLYTSVESDEYGKGKRGDLWSAAVTSVYVFDLGGQTLSVANMLGYFRTDGFDPLFSSGITARDNTVLRNGLMYATPVTLGEKKWGFQAHAINTHYFGDALYDNNVNEIGVSLGTGRTAFSARDYFRVGAAYIQGQHSKGFSLNLGYWF